MEEMFKCVVNEISSQYDNLIEKVLLQCGFTIQYCKEHPEEFLWIEDILNPMNKQLQWMGQHLFSIKEVLDYDEKNNKYSMEVNIEFGKKEGK